MAHADERHAPEPSPHPYPGKALIEKLQTAECWRLLEHTQIGCLAVQSVDGSPDVFPVNFLAHSGSIYIRSAPGSKLLALAARPAAAFEVDGESVTYRWSVVVRGTAQALEIDVDSHDAAVLALVSWSPTQKRHFIRLTPTVVTGRRFRVLPGTGPTRPDWPDSGIGRVRAAARAKADDSPPTFGGSTKPIPIPHFAPYPGR